MNTYTLPSYREALELLDGYANMERSAKPDPKHTDGLARMGRLLARLDKPHTAAPAIHVAGTKGKGSTSHYAAAALAAAGFRTGLYTSPHVEDLRERIMLNGRPVSELRFVEAAAVVFKEAAAMREDGDAPTYFEVLTAIAFVVFRNCGVEAMVLETGLGGRLDATNVPGVRVAAVGIAHISKDHEAILGDSLEAIAREKAEIIKQGVPTATLPQERAVLDIITKTAEDRLSPLFLVGRDVEYSFRKRSFPDKPSLGQRLDMESWRNVYPDIPLAMLGDHQAANAALALALVEIYLEHVDADPLDSIALKKAWRGLRLPARMEVIGDEPWHIVDGAHNPASAWAASETLNQYFTTRKRTLVFGSAKDKNYRVMLRILAPLFERVIVTGFDSARSESSEKLAERLKADFPELNVVQALDPAHALDLALERTPSDGLILTTGSLYLAGEMRALCRARKAKAART